MSVIQIVVNILAAFGLIVILGYLIYLLYKYVKDQKNKIVISSINPPGDYMQNSGIKCPDYWVNTGNDNKNYICKNSFNIQTNTDDSNHCNSDSLTFSQIPHGYTWEYGNPNGLTSLTDRQRYDFVNSKKDGSISRCDWINKCGPISSVQGTWSGVNEVCNAGLPSED